MARRNRQQGPTCIATTASGTRCRRAPLPGSTRCHSHTYAIPGRPTKLKPDVVETIISRVRLGSYFEIAAQSAGVDKTTLYRWLKRGEEAIAKAYEHVEDLDDVDFDELYNHANPADWPYMDFRHALKSAEAIAELELLEAVRVGGAGRASWQSAMTTLERRWPSRWGRYDRLKVDGSVDVATPRIFEPDTDRRKDIAQILSDSGALENPTDPRASEEESE